MYNCFCLFALQTNLLLLLAAGCLFARLLACCSPSTYHHTSGSTERGDGEEEYDITSCQIHHAHFRFRVCCSYLHETSSRVDDFVCLSPNAPLCLGFFLGSLVS
ncbi:hypothetical protein F5Y03DRAFT_246958 [Xylaria venustula]|nr:hypothetical protein F5Y03DRAFT_246958 [Xylaria venustula]